jgi:integrase
MAKRGLTDIAIRNFRAAAKRREIPDPGARGLYAVIQPSGRKGFAVRYRHAGKPRKLTLQSGISLAVARKLAAEAMHAVAEGRDPGTAKKEARAKAAAVAADTLQSVCEEYFRREGKNLRSAAEQEAVLRRHVYPALGSRQIHSITRKELIRLFDKIEDGSGPSAAQMAFTHTSKILNWFAVRDETFRTPIVRGMSRIKGRQARSRILGDAELVAVWTTACAAPGPPFPAMIRFLLLTAARRREASRLEWSEIADNGDWLLPAGRNKTKQDLLRPLSAAAQAVLAELPRFAGCNYAFTPNGVRPMSAYSTYKKQFDSACGVTGWTLHDLRRTARSLLSRAGVNSDHAERCLGHVLGGVRGVYDRHEYYAEKRQAFEALAALIERIVNPPPANVIEIGRRG